MPSVTGALWAPHGVTREVLLIGKYAIKIPKLTLGWKFFLTGLLSNMQEREFATCGWPELCPIVFSSWGGWLVIMRRATPLTDDEWEMFDWYGFVKKNGYVVPVERKRDSFGVLDARIVAVDYGN